MSKTKLERIEELNERIEQIKNRQKELKQQHNKHERKDRTKRLCQRMGLFKSMLPDNTPTEYKDRAVLWNVVEKSRKRKTHSLPARLNLPCLLN